jgi:hypothetical protein
MKISFSLLIVFLISGCFEPGDSSASDTGQVSISSSGVPQDLSSVVTATSESPHLNKEILKALSALPLAEIDYDRLSGVVHESLIDVRGDIEEAIGKQEKINYDRIHSIIFQTISDNLKTQKLPEPSQFQFICDVNERWIYRCNLQNGEIECFSMSSNKLKLISSVR